MRLSKRPASAARISCAKEQPSGCLLHADWMMLNNALLQMPHVGEETGGYSRQRFIYWQAWCEVYGAWRKPDIWIPCMVLERSNWGRINLYIELQRHKFDQILQEKHKKLSRQAYSFLQEKLRRLRRKTWEDKYFVPQSKHFETLKHTLQYKWAKTMH